MRAKLFSIAIFKFY